MCAKIKILNVIMPAKYSEDLRWRAVWLHLIHGWSADEIADVLFICKRSVERYLSLYHATGSVAPKNQQHGPSRLLSEFEQVALLQSLMIKPTMYLEELQTELYDLTGTWVHVSTICRTVLVQRLGLTRKKVQLVDLQCSMEMQARFMAEISIFDPQMLVWVDETGSARRNSVRTYGYSLKGIRAVSHQLRVGGKRINAIGVMSMQGMEDAYTVEGNVNGDVFERFVTRSLIPILKRFNGVDSHSVVIMDNASIHHLDKIAEIIAGTGALLRFLPPYSPELNPIEHVYSKVKAFSKVDDTVLILNFPPHQ